MYNRRKPLFTLLIGTGCRIGEVVGLRWEDVDMEKRVININHSLVYFAGRKNKAEQKWLVHEPKAEAEKRVIPMVDSVYTALVEEKSRQDAEGIKCKTRIGEMTGFIFCNRFSEVCITESVNRELKRIIENHNATEEVRVVKER